MLKSQWNAVGLSILCAYRALMSAKKGFSFGTHITFLSNPVCVRPRYPALEMKIQINTLTLKNQGNSPLLPLLKLSARAKCHRRKCDGTAVDM